MALSLLVELTAVVQWGFSTRVYARGFPENARSMSLSQFGRCAKFLCSHHRVGTDTQIDYHVST